MALLASLLFSAGMTMPVWVRARGDHSGDAPPHLAEIRVPLEPTVRKHCYDQQYGRAATFEGVALTKIIRDYGAPKGVDAAILHFANEMIVLVRLNELTVLNAFLAFALCNMTECRGDLPPVENKDDYYVDRHPLRFATNKLVVSKAANGFSPFRYTSTLVGIELVDGRAYERQFEVADTPGVRAGLTAFTQRCRSCHGVRGVGATLGWDFVKPFPLYTYRSPRSLSKHVRFRENDAPAKGIMMPTFPDMDDRTVKALWDLLEAFAKYPIRPYEPENVL
jgi:mono/diheme cytochrome c family protein